jgi:hypothetical protein
MHKAAGIELRGAQPCKGRICQRHAICNLQEADRGCSTMPLNQRVRIGDPAYGRTEES